MTKRLCGYHVVASLIVLIAMAFSSSPARAAFTLRFDPVQTSVTSDGLNKIVMVDLLITHSGAGPSTLSGFTVDVVKPPADLTISNPAAADFAWDLGPSISESGGLVSLGASNFGSGNVDVGANMTARLLTVDFTVDGAVIAQTFPLALSLRDANRNLFTDISTEFTVINGSFVVAAAVPEPSMCVLLGACVIGLSSCYRRRR